MTGRPDHEAPAGARDNASSAARPEADGSRGSRSRRTAVALLGFLGSRGCLVAALVIAIFLRAIPLALSLGHPGRLETADSADYLYLSDHVDAAYGDDEGTTAFNLGLLRTPGYPLVLRGVWEVAGHHPHAVAVVQMLFTCVAILALHRAARMLDTPSAGGLAALLIAVDPTAAIFSDLVLSETTFLLMMALAILAFVAVAQRPTLGRAALAGAVLGVSVLVRPVSQYLIVIAIVALVLAVRATGIKRAAAASVLVVYVVAAAVVPAAWAARNRSETGVVTVSTVDSYTLLYFAAAPILASADGIDYSTARARLQAEVASDLAPGANAAQRSRAELRLALRTLAEHPSATAKELVRSVGQTSVGPSRQTVRDVVSSDGSGGPWELPVMAWAFVVVAATWVGALLGAWLLIRQRRWGMLILLALPPCYLVAASLGQGYSRFRVPALPFLVVLAGIGGAQLLRRIGGADQPAPPG